MLFKSSHIIEKDVHPDYLVCSIIIAAASHARHLWRTARLASRLLLRYTVTTTAVCYAFDPSLRARYTNY
jgi:hypothetical protein